VQILPAGHTIATAPAPGTPRRAQCCNTAHSPSTITITITITIASFRQFLIGQQRPNALRDPGLAVGEDLANRRLLVFGDVVRGLDRLEALLPRHN
jgi:hypothetical protein